MSSVKNIINLNVGGLSNITTINLPEEQNPREIVLFGSNAGDLIGSGIYSDPSKNVADVNSVTFESLAANPGGPNTTWLSTGSKLYLGANAIGPITIGPIGATPNANAGTLTDGVLNLEPADATFGGVITTAAQTIAGEKTFTEDIFAQKTIQLPATADADHGALYIDAQAFLHSYGNASNTFLGINSCIDNSPVPAGENTGIGNNSLTSIIDPAQGNTALGSGSLPLLQTGTGNTAAGWTSLSNCLAGSNNSAFGNGTLSNCTGSRNIGIGYNAGSAVTSNNDTINIASAGSATSGEINIGTAGTHTKTTIAGIASVAPGGTPQMVVVNPSTGQLGSQAISLPKGSIYYIPAYPTGTNFAYAVQNTYYLLNLATTANGLNSSFTHNGAGRLTYTGTATTTFLVTAACSILYTGATSRTIGLDLRKNGTTTGTSQCYSNVVNGVTPQSMSLNGLVSLATNDYIEIYTANHANNNAMDFVSFMLTLVGLP